MSLSNHLQASSRPDFRRGVGVEARQDEEATIVAHDAIPVGVGLAGIVLARSSFIDRYGVQLGARPNGGLISLSGHTCQPCGAGQNGHRQGRS